MVEGRTSASRRRPRPGGDGLSRCSGTSKWNKIEHHLFSHIAVNWRGQPLTSHEVIVDLIAATETRSGLKVKARLDKGKYLSRLNVSDEEMASLCLKPHSFHGDWNYTLKHRRP